MNILKFKKYKLAWIALAFFAVLIPLIVLAVSSSYPYVGMSGIYNSNVYVGMSGVIHSRWYIGFNVPATYTNPSSPLGNFLSLYPVMFIAFAVLLLISIMTKKNASIMSLIIGAVLIYIAIAFLQGMNANINSILGIFTR